MLNSSWRRNFAQASQTSLGDSLQKDDSKPSNWGGGSPQRDDSKNGSWGNAGQKNDESESSSWGGTNNKSNVEPTNSEAGSKINDSTPNTADGEFLSVDYFYITIPKYI